MSIAPLIFQVTSADGAAGQPSPLLQMLPFAGILVILYFTMIRPQQKRQKEHQAMVNAVVKGDTIVTTGGLIGKITRVEDTEVVIDAGEGVKLRVLRAMIVEVRGKNTPQPANDTSKS
ncbi:preprotein translocase subunit YajC [Hirschia baltica]|uniref:Sec translocon accessory complex subunit YajC n=1 Tax=Hirschia baltica (strain ATCC 49814 / DSM 5838 / IFAM 1418) TaxID=582402 RepID=C6XJ01_HIRBI|nr:preprotein translocase subunit YajC [Hirschia baltica]ACT59096.1 preprotein translocase, YajC subunit [Hirschia baltica ATCC 49814]